MPCQNPMNSLSTNTHANRKLFWSCFVRISWTPLHTHERDAILIMPCQNPVDSPPHTWKGCHTDHALSESCRLPSTHMNGKPYWSCPVRITRAPLLHTWLGSYSDHAVSESCMLHSTLMNGELCRSCPVRFPWAPIYTHEWQAMLFMYYQNHVPTTEKKINK